MAFTEHFAGYFADFGTSMAVTTGSHSGASATVLFDVDGALTEFGIVGSGPTALMQASQLANLRDGDRATINAVAYEVRAVVAEFDGAFKRLTLAKV